MNRLLSMLAKDPLLSFGTPDGERGIWFEFGEMLQALQTWALWLLGG